MTIRWLVVAKEVLRTESAPTNGPKDNPKRYARCLYNKIILHATMKDLK